MSEPTGSRRKQSAKSKQASRMTLTRYPGSSQSQGPKVDERDVRRLKPPKRVWNNPKTWRTRTQNKHAAAPLPKARLMLHTSIENVIKIKEAIGGITLIYGLGIVLLVRGFSSTQDFVTLKALLDSVLTGASGKLQSVVVQLSALFEGNNASTSASGGIYQAILFIICSLAIIWVLRQSQAGQPVAVKTAFYHGMYPLIQFLGVVVIIGLQLLPLTIGSYVYGSLISGGIVTGFAERAVTLLAFLGLALWSLRMVTGSVFALYIVTLPDTEPWQAIRSAGQLVRGRRLLIWRKVLLLPLVLIVGTSLAVLPFLFILTPLVVWVFFFISLLWFPLTHSYMYTLYRELLNDA